MNFVFCTARTRVLVGVQYYFTLKVHQPINQQKQALVPHRKDTKLACKMVYAQEKPLFCAYKNDYAQENTISCA